MSNNENTSSKPDRVLELMVACVLPFGALMLAAVIVCAVLGIL